MSSLGLMTYHTTHKNILQQSSVNNNNQSKQCYVDYSPKSLLKDDFLLTNSTRKKTTNKFVKDAMKPNPQILAVARRNARERNRVKQVNNGFANLRERIPNFIAASYESGRGNNKKLSKVETLRMAVEYIRSLEDLLALNDQEAETLSRNSYESSPSHGSSNMISRNNGSYQFSDMSASADEEMSTSSSPPPQQYVRINTTTNTYEIIPAHLYEDCENFEPLIDVNLSNPETRVLNGTDIDYRDVKNINLLSSIIDSRDSLSPGMYSDHSFSSEEIEKLQNSKCFVPAFSSIIDSNNKLLLSSIKKETPDESLAVSFKTEDETMPDEKNMMNVIQWWQNPNPTPES